ncbi:fumarylacetoacetate hydrolase family protein [Orrella sp. 11846]|uniref:fumarylacetoacetate hydrolase family protein n=1 Tax=Orrella sp. 11846 TaxID=3409913 RepID=UPI003B5C9D6F
MKKLISFYAAGQNRFGILHDKGITDLSTKTGYASLRDLIAAGDRDALNASQTADFSEDEVQFLTPVPNADKVLCIGVNYANRNAEYKDDSALPKYPSLFTRTNSSLVGQDQPLMLPPESEQFDYEGEIALVIGKAGRRISQEDAMSHVFGLTLCNEGCVRDWMRHGKFNVTQGKNFDASGSMGPWIVPIEDMPDLSDLSLKTYVNDELRQSDTTANMIFPFAYLISYLSTFMTLLPGDVIVTGTPTGSGARFDPPKYLKDGDVVRVEATGLGVLQNTVRRETV